MQQSVVTSQTDTLAPSSQRGTWISLLVGAALGILALALIARSVNLNLTLQALAASHLVLFLLAFLAQMIAVGFTLRRWQILLKPYPTHFLNLGQIFFIAHLLNTLLPAKLGTVARVLLAAESENLNVGLVLGSVAIEKVLDTLVMLVFLAILAPFAPLPLWLRESLTASVLLVLAAFVALVSAARFREQLLTGLASVESRLFGHESRRVAALASGMVESLVNLTQRREAVRVLFWTALIWLTGGIVNQLLLAAVGLSLDWTAAWFLLVVLQIGTRVPALPANLGVFHYLVILALGVYGVNESTALAYAILLHLIVFILPAFIGAACALPVSARLGTLLTRAWNERQAIPKRDAQT
ncbi:MAG TPA: lysylphosphatidylglycerol synthase transmembrane domain-containing protein [Anaerolineae bacterium]|nr:lysylphosphatidylglycerol synthase transmembrane domain-containing protein [Anaerolineae bacterium]